jgi:hypothetical protein
VLVQPLNSGWVLVDSAGVLRLTGEDIPLADGFWSEFENFMDHLSG